MNFALETRYKLYNETLEYIEELESKNEIVVIRPTKNLKVGRVERNQEKLTQLYALGYEDAKESFERIDSWINNKTLITAK